MNIQFIMYSDRIPHLKFYRVFPDILYMMMCRHLGCEVPYAANISKEYINDLRNYANACIVMPELVEDIVKQSTSHQDMEVAYIMNAFINRFNDFDEFLQRNPINHSYLYRYELDGALTK